MGQEEVPWAVRCSPMWPGSISALLLWPGGLMRLQYHFATLWCSTIARGQMSSFSPVLPSCIWSQLVMKLSKIDNQDFWVITKVEKSGIAFINSKRWWGKVDWKTSHLNSLGPRLYMWLLLQEIPGTWCTQHLRVARAPWLSWFLMDSWTGGHRFPTMFRNFHEMKQEHFETKIAPENRCLEDYLGFWGKGICQFARAREARGGVELWVICNLMALPWKLLSLLTLFFYFWKNVEEDALKLELKML